MNDRRQSNTQEPLFVVNRSGNRPSHEGAAERFDQSIALCRRAGFRKITLRGNTDFSQTEHLDRWQAEGVRFVFGIDAMPNLVNLAEKRAVLRMEFRTFLNAMMRLPTQIVKQGRKTIYRLLGWNRWLPVFLRGWEQVHVPLPT